MFGLLKAKPPLGPWEKAWTENRMCWLADELGMERLLESPTLVPGYAGLPDVSDVSTATQLLDFVQRWMKLDNLDAHIQVFSNVVTMESIGTEVSNQDSLKIEILQDQFQDRDDLIAIMARQLAKKTLVEGDSCEPMDEWTVDLLPAFLGLGIFAANASIKGPTTANDVLQWWSARKHGYLPSRMFGYALALRSTTRGDQDYHWANLLRQDAQVTFREGLKYLEKTNDTVFSRGFSTRPRDEMAIDAVLDELKSRSPSRKILAMWEMANRATQYEGEPNHRVSDLLMDCLRHKESEVRAVAATTLPAYDRSQHAAEYLVDTLRDSNDEVRIAAARSLAYYSGVDDETIVHDLTIALKDDVGWVVFNAARSLTFYGKAAQPATNMLLKRLRRTLVECRDDDTRMLIWALNEIVEDTTLTINEFFGDSDAEFRDFSIQMLDQLEVS